MHNIFKPTYSKKSRRVPLVLWSGGVDSTFLVFHHLRSGRVIDTVSIDGGQHYLKVMRESIARMALWRAFQNADMDADLTRLSKQICVPEHKGDTHTAHGLLNKGGFQQILSWIIGVMRYYDPEKHSHVEMAYVMGDDMAAYVQYIADTFHALGMLQFCEPVKVYFPFMRNRKSQFYELMQRHTVMAASEGRERMSLLDLTWVCELPEVDGHCGYCAACKKDAEVRKEVGLEPRKKVALDYNNLRLQQLTPDMHRNASHRPMGNFDCLMAFNVAYPTRYYPTLHSEREVELNSQIIQPGEEDVVEVEPPERASSIDREDPGGEPVIDDVAEVASDA